MPELIVAFLLILLNGVFALSELAIVSSRRSRLKTMAEAGRTGASTALALSEHPGRLLSTVQIGITLIGLLAGAVSGAALGAAATEWFSERGLPEWGAEAAGYGVVISAITYLSVVVGELVPKQIALRDPETAACRIAPFMFVLSKVAAPFVWLLDASSGLVMRLFGGRAEKSGVTEDEIRSLVAEAETAGVIEGPERRMIAGVLRLGDRSARGLMTPRMEVDWIDVTMPLDEVRARLGQLRHSRAPAAEANVDSIIGVIEIRDLLQAFAAGATPDLRAMVKSAPVVPDTLDALGTLDVLRQAEVPMALVHDEYGHFEGVVTPADFLDTIAGALRSDESEGSVAAVSRGDGTWLIDGAMQADELAELLSLALPEQRGYETAAGFVIDVLQRLPSEGDRLAFDGWLFEIVDMDGRRIDKLLVTRNSKAS